GHASHVARGLVGEAGEGGAFGFRLDDTAQGATVEERIVDRAGGRRELPHGYAQRRAAVQFLTRLHQPAGLGQLPVDRYSRAVLGMENVLPRIEQLRVTSAVSSMNKNRTISPIPVAASG